MSSVKIPGQSGEATSVLVLVVIIRTIHGRSNCPLLRFVRSEKLFPFFWLHRMQEECQKGLARMFSSLFLSSSPRLGGLGESGLAWMIFEAWMANRQMRQEKKARKMMAGLA